MGPEPRDLSADFRAAKKIRMKWPGSLAVFAGTLVTAWCVDRLGHLELALPIVNTIAVLAFVILIKKNLRKKLWFWVFMMIVAVLHIVFLLTVSWTTKWVPAFAIAFIDTVDLFGILMALSFISNEMGGSR